MQQKLEEEKYYIPDINEFYIGFEYQWFSTDNKIWSDTKISKSDFTYGDYGETDFYYTCKLLLQTKCRVKYLDREDIESLLKNRLDFETITYEEDNQFEFQFWKGGMKYYGLYINSDKIISFYEDDECIFRGEVKNKSELKFIIRSISI